MSPKKRAQIGRHSNASKKKKNACIQEADSSAHDFEEQSLIQEDSTRGLEGVLLEEKRHKLEKRRSQQIARQTEPQENRAERLQKNKERQRIARQTESQEKRTERLQKNKERQRIARQNETDVQRQQRLKKNRNRLATSRHQTICDELPESNNGSIEQDRQQHSVQHTRTSERKQNNGSNKEGLRNTAAQPPSPAADCGEDEDEGDGEMDGFEILRIKIEDLKSDGPEDEGPEDGMVKTRKTEPGSLVFMGLKEGARLMKKQDRAGRVTSTKETNEQKKRRRRRPRNTENSKETRRAHKSSLHQGFLHTLQKNINTDGKTSSEDE